MTDGYAWLGTTNGTDTFLSSTTYPGDTTQGDVLYASADHTISSLAKNTSATRYLSNTGTSNAPAWAQVALGTGVSGQLPLANGGTNANLTANVGGIFYSTATAGAILSGTATAGQIVQSGASAAPSWSTTTYPSTTAQGDIIYATAANVLGALAKDTNATRYLSNTGTSNAPAWAQINVSNGITGQVPLANGGTAANLVANIGGIFYSTASAAAILSGTATANQVLLSGSSAAPAWSTATYPATTTINRILYSSAANTVTGLATANNSVLVTSGSGVPSLSTSVDTDFSFTKTGAGTRFLRAQNLDNATATANAGVAATTSGAGSGDPMLQVAVTGVTTWTMGIDNSVTTPAADPFVLASASTLGTASDVMTITTAGSVSKPLQPAFFAYLSATATDVTGDATVYTLALNTELFDQQNNFDNTTYTFTAPVTGKYMVTVATQLLQISASHTLVESKIVVAGTSANTYILFSLSGAARDSNNNMIMTNSLLIPMTATDTFTVTVQANGGTKVVDVFGGVTGTSVSAYLVC